MKNSFQRFILILLYLEVLFTGTLETIIYVLTINTFLLTTRIMLYTVLNIIHNVSALMFRHTISLYLCTYHYFISFNAVVYIIYFSFFTCLLLVCFTSDKSVALRHALIKVKENGIQIDYIHE